jgi:aldehyde dehydrogenase (NAD+)
MNNTSHQQLSSRSPIDGRELGKVPVASRADCDQALTAAVAAFKTWRAVPAPIRGEFVRQFAEEVRTQKKQLAELLVLEVGKTPSEAEGEVQEVIDICDFAVGLSRQLQGLTLPSERARHHMLERWHPLGIVAVITAFNFPMAVWAWNAALAWVCGNSVVWKPSEKTPLTAAALQEVFNKVQSRQTQIPQALCMVLQGGREVGEALCDDARVALVSATGSTRMGRDVGARVAKRFGRTLLELGGNNAMIITPSADENLALRAMTFAAAGTAGQRCTSLRRAFIHESRYDALVGKLKQIFSKLKVGDPRSSGVLVGPLIDQHAFDAMQAALVDARHAKAVITGGERVTVAKCEAGIYARPALVEMTQQTPLVLQETFAPILYLLKYSDFSQAIAANNIASQGLSSSVLTRDLLEAELFLSAEGSDCGIANVNTGTSGAEIGGAFGGEKETGGGRESGSDAWKAYMRRQTQVVNYSTTLPLAQGVQFEID